MRGLTAVAVIAAAVVCAFPAAGEASASTRRCANVLTRYIHGTHVTVSRSYRCKPARALLRRYFRKVVRTGQVQGGCAQRRWSGGCAVGNFLCTVRYRHRVTRGRCADGIRVVRYRERDFAPHA